MPYHIRVEGRLVQVYWHGYITREDLESIDRDLPRVAEELGFAPDVLHMLDGVVGRRFQPVVVHLVSLLRRRLQIPTPVRAAVVATTAEAHMIASLFKTVNRTPNLHIEVFASEEAARRWLTEPRPDALAASA